MKTIMTDARVIKHLIFSNGDFVTYRSGRTIVPYEESRDIAYPAVWFKVIEEKAVVQRINGDHVQQIIYEGS